MRDLHPLEPYVDPSQIPSPGFSASADGYLYEIHEKLDLILDTLPVLDIQRTLSPATSIRVTVEVLD